MTIVDVFGKYKVYIGQNLLNNLAQIFDARMFSKIIVITDKNIPPHFLAQYEKIIVPAGELNKNIEVVQIIWKKLLGFKADRKSLVINLGGGVVGDMGGFAAATYMRGISFIQAPTTLLSSVDASVGGKVGIDFAGVKNLIGAFSQPFGVIIDTNTLKSLPAREFVSGFSEIIKHGIINDANYFKFVTSKKPAEFIDPELIEIIKRSCQIKAGIIFSDEKETGKRKLLNFGHTIGHALESASLETNRPLLHGEAISLGMVAEAKISEALGLIPPQITALIKSSLDHAGLPTYITINNQQKIISLLSQDKKSEAGNINWTLINGLGSAVINQNVPLDKIITALNYIS